MLSWVWLFFQNGKSYIRRWAHLHIRVKNDSLAPLLGAKVDRELRKTMLRNGSFILVSNRDKQMFFLRSRLKAIQ